jgi:hypothetical protein
VGKIYHGGEDVTHTGIVPDALDGTQLLVEDIGISASRIFERLDAQRDQILGHGRPNVRDAAESGNYLGMVIRDGKNARHLLSPSDEVYGA